MRRLSLVHSWVSSKNQVPTEEWEVPGDQGDAHLDRVVRARFPWASWNEVRGWIRGGNVFVGEARATDSTATVLAGQLVAVCEKPSQRKKPAASGESPKREAPAPRLIVHADSQVVVVEKPSGISTVPYDETEKDTLERRVQKQLARSGARSHLHVVHRIDKETTGLLVFARTQQALLALKSQFRFHNVKRRYLAIVHGHARPATIKSMLARDRGDGLRGSTTFQGQGRESVTHVRVLAHLEGASLIECTLETGRTHQIRIHLSESGHPLLGDRVYSKGYKGQLLEAPRVLLHATTLGFMHPTEERVLTFESPVPADFAARLKELGG